MMIDVSQSLSNIDLFFLQQNRISKTKLSLTENNDSESNLSKQTFLPTSFQQQWLFKNFLLTK